MKFIEIKDYGVVEVVKDLSHRPLGNVKTDHAGCYAIVQFDGKANKPEDFEDGIPPFQAGYDSEGRGILLREVIDYE